MGGNFEEFEARREVLYQGSHAEREGDVVVAGPTKSTNLGVRDHLENFFRAIARVEEIFQGVLLDGTMVGIDENSGRIIKYRTEIGRCTPLEGRSLDVKSPDEHAARCHSLDVLYE